MASYHSKICELAHTAMTHLFAVNLLDPQDMQAFDRLCLNGSASPQESATHRAPAPRVLPAEPLPAAAAPAFDLQTAAALRMLREREGVNPTVFARYFDVQPQVVLAWEAGFLRPTATAARLLAIVAEKGLGALSPIY